MLDEHRESTKTQLAAALAQGVSVGKWARENDVPNSTAYRWASEPEIRRAVEASRRRALDRAVTLMTKRAGWAAGRIIVLAARAESESVRLRAARAIFGDMMSVSRYSDLEDRMTKIEERGREDAGNADRTV